MFPERYHGLSTLLTSVSGLSRVQLLRSGSQLKFIPEEVLIHGRDFRLLRVGFEAGELAPQALQVRTLYLDKPFSPRNLRAPSMPQGLSLFLTPLHSRVTVS